MKNSKKFFFWESENIYEFHNKKYGGSYHENYDFKQF